MKKLEMLTAKLVSNLKDISYKDNSGYIRYELDKGEVITFTLKKDSRVHILDSLLVEGTIFPLHNHKGSDETLILQSGEVTVICPEPNCGDIRHELKPGVPFYLPNGMNHFLHAKKTSWVLAVIIPPDEGMY